MLNKKTLVANWKMNGDKELITQFNEILNNQTLKHDVIVCPSFVHLPFFHPLSFKIGAQDCDFHEKGAFTGSISPVMLKEIGATYVIIGHSERRVQHFETNRVIQKKEEAAHNAGLIPIVCIGETQEDYTNKKTFDVLKKQLIESTNQFTSTIIAYEPIWAIGTGLAPHIDEIKNTLSFIKNIFPNNQVIYGGSVSLDNIQQILAHELVDGCLIGGASLNANTFLDMINAV